MVEKIPLKKIELFSANSINNQEVKERVKEIIKHFKTIERNSIDGSLQHASSQRLGVELQKKNVEKLRMKWDDYLHCFSSSCKNTLEPRQLKEKLSS